MTDDKYTSRTENVGQFRCETTYARSEEKTFTDLSASYGGREKYPTPGMLLMQAFNAKLLPNSWTVFRVI